MSCTGTGSCGHSPCPHEAELHHRIDKIVAEQGWSSETVGDLTWQFITENGLYAKLVTFFEAKAKEENETMEIDSNCPTCQSKNHTMMGQLGQKLYIRCRSCGTNYQL